MFSLASPHHSRDRGASVSGRSTIAEVGSTRLGIFQICLNWKYGLSACSGRNIDLKCRRRRILRVVGSTDLYVSSDQREKVRTGNIVVYATSR